MTVTAAVYGTKPEGTAKGDERWAAISSFDNQVTVTAYVGWGVTDVVHLTGDDAVAMAPRIAELLAFGEVRS